MYKKSVRREDIDVNARHLDENIPTDVRQQKASYRLRIGRSVEPKGKKCDDSDDHDWDVMKMSQVETGIYLLKADVAVKISQMAKKERGRLLSLTNTTESSSVAHS